VAISVRAQGLEETSVGCVISPPAGAHLYSAVKDVGGFVHHDLNASTTMYDSPTFGATVALDFAELAPATIVRVGAAGPAGLALSTDSGTSWTAATLPDGVTGPGADDSSVALSADGMRVVWSPAGAPVVYSTDSGVTWQTSTGIAPGTPIRADRVNPMTFYAFAAGTFQISTDGAATFTATAATGLPTEGSWRFKPAPGREGDIWLAGGKSTSRYGLWRSVDSGATFTKLPQVDEGDVVGFGKAAPGRSYPAVYTSAKINGVRGIFRSDDAGKHSGSTTTTPGTAVSCTSTAGRSSGRPRNSASTGSSRCPTAPWERHPRRHPRTTSWPRTAKRRPPASPPPRTSC
jgi:xyloglucan-specific exo-beta-1,4-glucanase